MFEEIDDPAKLTDAILIETDMGFADRYCPGASADGSVPLKMSCSRVHNCSCDCDRCHCFMDLS
jgi:hypothetical protein